MGRKNIGEGGDAEITKLNAGRVLTMKWSRIRSIDAGRRTAAVCRYIMYQRLDNSECWQLGLRMHALLADVLCTGYNYARAGRGYFYIFSIVARGKAI